MFFFVSFLSPFFFVFLFLSFSSPIFVAFPSILFFPRYVTPRFYCLLRPLSFPVLPSSSVHLFPLSSFVFWGWWGFLFYSSSPPRFFSRPRAARGLR
ncbi:hypothetical protein C8J57DRAFT_1275568 [Mycena rebaudengoi]|nr:hypothetical protein C8J57DRAFT_1275568 [Mycena rebaudengoi]